MEHAKKHNVDIVKIKQLEEQIDDVMEVIDQTQLEKKLISCEHAFNENNNELNTLRLGIIYHEKALNSLLNKDGIKGYAQKSYDILKGLANKPGTDTSFFPFIDSYKASALSLISADTKKLNLLGKAFREFDAAVEEYSDIHSLPEFLRGSVAENLPPVFFFWRKYAVSDFASIIKKYESDSNYATAEIMSFTYWAWANQHQGKKNRSQALIYLDKAIELDPNYKGGRRKAEELKQKLSY